MNIKDEINDNFISELENLNADEANNIRETFQRINTVGVCREDYDTIESLLSGSIEGINPNRLTALPSEHYKSVALEAFNKSSLLKAAAGAGVIGIIFTILAKLVNRASGGSSSSKDVSRTAKDVKDSHKNTERMERDLKSDEIYRKSDEYDNNYKAQFYQSTNLPTVVVDSIVSSEYIDDSKHIHSVLNRLEKLKSALPGSLVYDLATVRGVDYALLNVQHTSYAAFDMFDAEKTLTLIKTCFKILKPFADDVKREKKPYIFVPARGEPVDELVVLRKYLAEFTDGPVANLEESGFTLHSPLPKISDQLNKGPGGGKLGTVSALVPVGGNNNASPLPKEYSERDVPDYDSFTDFMVRFCDICESMDEYVGDIEIPNEREINKVADEINLDDVEFGRKRRNLMVNISKLFAYNITVLNQYRSHMNKMLDLLERSSARYEKLCEEYQRP